MALDAFPEKGNVGLDPDQNSSSPLSHQISTLGANSVGTKWYLNDITIASLHIQDSQAGVSLQKLPIHALCP